MGQFFFLHLTSFWSRVLSILKPVSVLKLISFVIICLFVVVVFLLFCYLFVFVFQKIQLDLFPLFDIKNSSLNVVVATRHSCEMTQSRHTVGFGGIPDESGEATLSAMITHGSIIIIEYRWIHLKNILSPFTIEER